MYILRNCRAKCWLTKVLCVAKQLIFDCVHNRWRNILTYMYQLILLLAHSVPFHSLHELLRDGHNGMVFSESSELCAQFLVCLVHYVVVEFSNHKWNLCKYPLLVLCNHSSGCKQSNSKLCTNKTGRTVSIPSVIPGHYTLHICDWIEKQPPCKKCTLEIRVRDMGVWTCCSRPKRFNYITVHLGPFATLWWSLTVISTPVQAL